MEIVKHNGVVATELEYLRYFFITADFGPAHEDCVYAINNMFKADTGKELPKGYEEEE